ncbi:MAG: hypothetical protein K0R70_627 [Steroidobacteraceae bacterium]|nr:hypothetical protein [Steroidobacteraceae bacterium]
MRRWILTFAAVTMTSLAGGAVADPPPTVDLRDAAALQQLRDRNPAHFATIQRILAGLAEDPERVEGDWLRTTFDARDVELSRLLLKTSHPPRQQLRFTLDDTRYALHVVRSDLGAEPQVLR